MNILLFEKRYVFARGNTVLLSHRKIATYHKKRGDFVIFTNEKITRKLLFKFPNNKVDIVYFSTLFTYDLNDIISNVFKLRNILGNHTTIKIGGIASTLLPDYVKSKTGIEPHVGLWDEIESLAPNYSKIFPNVKHGTCFTTRGCIRNCGFCAVKKLEPQFYVVENWKDQINAVYKAGIKKLNIQDNNFIASPFSHQEEVIKYLSKDINNKLLIDFNQALDCRLFKNKHARLLKKIRLANYRFAFDSMQTEDGFFQNAIERIVRHHKSIYPYFRILMLYNYKEPPEDVYSRLKIIYDFQQKFPNAEFHAYLMRYQPLDTLEKNKYVGKYWSKKELKNFKVITNLVSFRGAMIFKTKFKNNARKGYIFNTLDFIGRNKAEFKEIINKKLYFKNGKYQFKSFKPITSYLKKGQK